MRKNVATNKPHIQAYIDKEINEKLLEYRDENGYSKSEAIESLLKIYLGLDDETIKAFKKWSIKEKRTIDRQAQLVLENATKDAACALFEVVLILITASNTILRN